MTFHLFKYNIFKDVQSQLCFPIVHYNKPMLCQLYSVHVLVYVQDNIFYRKNGLDSV